VSNVENAPLTRPYLEDPERDEFYFDNATMRRIFLDDPTAPSSCTVLRAREIGGRFRDRIPWDDYLMLLEMILTRGATGSFVARRLLTKNNHRDGVCEGGLAKLALQAQVVFCMGVILRNFRGYLRPGERERWDRMLAEFAFDLGYDAVTRGRPGEALRYYATSYRHGPSWRPVWAALKALVPRRPAAPQAG
jgi:hypothetical protein